MGTIGAALAWARQRLAEAGVAGDTGAEAGVAEVGATAAAVDAEREASWLLAHLLGCSAGDLRLRRLDPLGVADAERFAALVERRARREPIQYILGTEEFMGLTFRVSPAVLIPRLDTEVLVRQAAALLAGRVRGMDQVWGTGRLRVADIGTGSGAIAVTLAHLLPEATVVAVDLSQEALAVAAGNARLNGVAGRVDFRQGDLLAPLAGERFDAILSNPPYVGADEVSGLMPEVRDWEPHIALTPGTDGLSFYRRLAAEAATYLVPGGLLGVEVGIGQAEAVVELFRQAGFVGLSVHRDTGGVDRAVFGSVAH